MQDKRFILPTYTTLRKSHHLRAEGNLQYLDFIRLVEEMWKQSHPGIPFSAMGGQQHAKYPCIVYSLKLRKTMEQEPKPRREREQIFDTDNRRIIISSQRFQNIIAFTAISENDPRLAEELIEAFEDFMFEYIPVFKRLGLSDIFYSRRLADSDENRNSEDICKRTVTYLIITEKVFQTDVEKINEIAINIRRYFEQEEELEQATPNGIITTTIVDEFAGATPNY